MASVAIGSNSPAHDYSDDLVQSGLIIHWGAAVRRGCRNAVCVKGSP